MKKQNFRANARSFMSKAFCSVMIATTIVSFASCINTPTAQKGGVIINGVEWAICNVDVPGTFAASPENAGRFYQWNRKTAWAATDEVSNWDSSYPDGITSNWEWEKANDPCPDGWRVPTPDEIKSLLDEDKVSLEYTIQNGVNGSRFTDKKNGNSIFLPHAGVRNSDNGMLYVSGKYGYYWGSAHKDKRLAYCFFLNGPGR
ncbi:hypothetical protein AGMMS49525_15650 [Bacteroidia bacterium]|nr:hypothetical protein AGMMS49525_15650 [Bacteroidia bacterium]